VDDQPHNGDADYNQATAADTIDRFNMETLPAELTGPIYGLRPLAMAKKTDAGTGSLSTLVVAGGVDYLQTETGLGTSYQPVAPDILTINPNTGAAWTSGQINAPLVAGYKRVQ
jgi:hypothetical protein